MVYSIPIYGQLLAMIRHLNIPVFRQDYVSAYHALTFQRTCKYHANQALTVDGLCRVLHRGIASIDVPEPKDNVVIYIT